MARKKLSEEEIETALAGLSGWTTENKNLKKRFEFNNLFRLGLRRIFYHDARHRRFDAERFRFGERNRGNLITNKRD
jgi:hypothetical protein